VEGQMTLELGTELHHYFVWSNDIIRPYKAKN